MQTAIAGLDQQTLDTLVERGEVINVPRGWMPMHEQTAADRVFLVLHGHLTVSGHGDRLASLGPGDLVGEMGPVGHRLRSADVVADDEVQVLAWPRADFDRLRSELPDFDELVRRTTEERRADNAARRAGDA